VRRVSPVGVVASLLLCLLCGGTADAASTAGPALHRTLVGAAAASPDGDAIGLRVDRRGRVTTTVTAFRTRASVLAVRSSVDARWALVVITPLGRPDARRTFMLERRAGRWRVLFAAGRGEELGALCRRERPGTAVALDLGLDASATSGRCRHPRAKQRLTRPMDAAEVASVRAMVEWRFDELTGAYEPGPVQPAAHEVFASNCSWDGRGDVVEPPYGSVSRSDPRWGLLVVSCVTGSDGFALLENPTAILVRRAGTSGPFAAALAHTFMSWSVQTVLCREDGRWPIPATARVELQFCTPFPAALIDALN
jgi:hypothetical protein